MPDRLRPIPLQGDAQEEGQRLVSLLMQLVEPLAQALPPTTEVVLHDLSKLPKSIVAIAGEVTARKVGDPPTDVLLHFLRSGDESSLVGYRTELPGGHEGRSTTIILRLISGEPVAALCINSDVTQWRQASQLLAGFLRQGAPKPPDTPGPPTADMVDPSHAVVRRETFAHSVDELADALIGQAIAAVGVPVELMKKQHKVEVVAELESRGLFMIRDAVDMVATALQVTRYTIYNYLNEIAAEREKEPFR